MSSTTRIPIQAAVAVTPSYGIGKGGKLPWQQVGHRFSKDLKHFQRVTTTTSDPTKKNAVIMGRVTWESIESKFKPLPNRINVVLSSDATYSTTTTTTEDILHAISLQDAMNKLTNDPRYGSTRIENAVVIGGVKLFEEAILHPLCTGFHVTYIDREYDCDTFLTDTTIAKLKSLTTPPPSTSSDDVLVENEVSLRLVTVIVIFLYSQVFHAYFVYYLEWSSTIQTR